MNNKRLEDRLLKYGNAYIELIHLIEKAEAGGIEEIRFSDKHITQSAILDRMIFTYLKKLKVSVVYVAVSEAEEDGRPKCQSDIHKILDSDMKKAAKIKTFKKSGAKMLKIDISSFVICSACSDIKEIK